MKKIYVSECQIGLGLPGTSFAVRIRSNFQEGADKKEVVVKFTRSFIKTHQRFPIAGSKIDYFTEPIISVNLQGAQKKLCDKIVRSNLEDGIVL